MAQDAKSRLPKENTQTVLFSRLIFDAFTQIKKGDFLYARRAATAREKRPLTAAPPSIFLDRAGKGDLFFPLLAKDFFPKAHGN